MTQDPSPSPLSTASTQLSRYATVLLLAAAIIPAVGALGAPFYWIDDHEMIHNNPVINGTAPLAQIFTTPHFGHYAPLHELLIRVEWSLFGGHALGFRLVSLALHALAALGCFAMLKNLTGRRLLALGVAVLWTVHPIQPESVDWITEQKTLWCGLFSFAALAVYFNPARSRMTRISLAALLMILGGLGKSPALIVGPLVLLYELCIASRETPPAPPFQGGESRPPERNLLAAVPLLVLSTVFAKLALWANDYTENRIAWRFTDTLLNLPGTLLVYLRTAFLPWTASFFQDLDRVFAFSSPEFYGKLAALVALFALGFVAAGAARRRLFLFCAFAWVLALGPMLNVSATTFPAYDRFQYMALPFLLLGAAILLEPLFAWLARIQRDLKLSALHASAWGLALLFVASLGFVRGTLFASELGVMLDATAKAPHNACAYGQFANTLYPEWEDAKKNNRMEDEQKIAQTIAGATEKARHCWNFDEFYVTPGPLLVMTGQVLHESGLRDEAVPFLEAATAPRWSRFTQAVEQAHRLLAVIHLERAAQHLLESENAGTSPELSEKLANMALEEIENSRRQFGASDTAFWCSYLAHKQLAKLEQAKGDVVKTGAEARAAIEALKLISKKSPYYPRAQEALHQLKP